MNKLLLTMLVLILASCVTVPKTSPQEYRASVECTALLNLSIGLQQQDRNIPDAELASSRNAWIRKAANYEGFNQQRFQSDVTQLGNAVVAKFNGKMAQQSLSPLVNRCLLR